MIKYIVRAAALLASLLPWPQANAAPPPRPVTVDILSAWGGLGSRPTLNLHIGYENGTFRAGGKIVPRAKIEALVTALEAPRIAQPDQGNLGIDAAWREGNADKAFGAFSTWSRVSMPEQKAFYIASFKDPQVMRDGLHEGFRSFHTDDYPLVEVKVAFSDGSTRTAVSMSQSVFLLPWDTTPDGHESNYNADISRALAALMPEGATNRERLLGIDLLRWTADGVWLAVRDKLDRIKAEARAGRTLALLASKYSVVIAQIDTYTNAIYGKDGAEDNLHVSLRDAKLPQSVTYAVVLPLRGDEAQDASVFVGSADRYRSTFARIGWLQDYIRAHPAEQMWLTFVHDASLGDKAFAVFAADMHALGKDGLARLVGAERARVVLLQTGIPERETYWILLPDGRTILWRYDRSEGLLKWKPGDLTVGNCTEPGSFNGGCVGAVISAGGELEKSD
jgi:hypothetical protein